LAWNDELNLINLLPGLLPKETAQNQLTRKALLEFE
jgi:hypothetical protein